MMDYLRIMLYYPLGLLPAVFFTLRFLIQWLQSEKAKQSFVAPIFWKLSFAGNILQILHYFIQIQYPFAMIQAGNALISWRNLCWMRSTKNNISTKTFIFLLITTLVVVTTGFMIQSYFVIGEMDWVRTPTKLFDEVRTHHSLGWHIFGAIGAMLFASRFWLQWWQSEKTQRSQLGETFWMISIVGSIMSLIYFIRIGDTVSIVQYGFGLVPYVRNLMLLRHKDLQDKKITG